LKAKMTFRPRTSKIKIKQSRRERNFKLLIIGIFSLLLLNFIWDGMNRKKELEKYYGISYQYYGIIVKEVDSTVTRIKDKIKNIDIKRK